MMQWKAKWIRAAAEPEGCPEFIRKFDLDALPSSAILSITATGVYEVYLNGKRVSNYVLAPGWTSYATRHQYQQYEVSELLQEHNIMCIGMSGGWYHRRAPAWAFDWNDRNEPMNAVIAQLEWETGGLWTDEDWQVRESAVRFSSIYDGETYDARIDDPPCSPVKVIDKGTENLIAQEGEIICEQDVIYPARIFRTHKGECVVDFGQEITGYVQLELTAQRGERVTLSHAEMLDKEGNFYTENYRSAKAKLCYICRDGHQSYKPHFTFFGFRYIRADEFPGTPSLDNFKAIVVCSDLRRTGDLRCGDPEMNRLFENIFWGQRGNYLDIPTDCPQRDERLGWTGDAQVFVKTASYNYDVRKFFHKWLADLAADQAENGAIPHVVPAALHRCGSAAWDDAAVICPWQLYMTYGDREILRRQFHSMVRYIDYICGTTKDAYLWTGGTHYGDWLGLDAPAGSYKGSSRPDFIASAYFAYSTALVAKTAAVLEEDASRFEKLHGKIVEKFRSVFPEYTTQTEHVLALQFGLAEDPAKTADDLAAMIAADGGCLKTGFVGTPYLLHVLSQNGHVRLAYDLLLRREYPSWLFSVTQGATTMWEHWDGYKEDGSFWSADMNSFNHYAYGAVGDWVYEEAAGIHIPENAPGFQRIRFAPQADKRLGWLEASIETVRGPVRSKWVHEGDRVRYELQTPVEAEIEIDGRRRTVGPGAYLLFGQP